MGAGQTVEAGTVMRPKPPGNTGAALKLVRPDVPGDLGVLQDEVFDPEQLTGCEKVFVQSQALREPNPKNIFMNPAKFAHSDATEKSPPQWRKFLVKKQGYTEEQARDTDICMCNVWHPRDIPACVDPLCLLDSSTVDYEKDTAPIPFVDGKGEPARNGMA